MNRAVGSHCGFVEVDGLQGAAQVKRRFRRKLPMLMRPTTTALASRGFQESPNTRPWSRSTEATRLEAQMPWKRTRRVRMPWVLGVCDSLESRNVQSSLRAKLWSMAVSAAISLAQASPAAVACQDSRLQSTEVSTTQPREPTTANRQKADASRWSPACGFVFGAGFEAGKRSRIAKDRGVSGRRGGVGGNGVVAGGAGGASVPVPVPVPPPVVRAGFGGGRVAGQDPPGPSVSERSSLTDLLMDDTSIPGHSLMRLGCATWLAGTRVAAGDPRVMD